MKTIDKEVFQNIILIRKLFDECIDEFDFDKVQKVMWAINWKWSMPNDFRVPTLDETKEHCERLFKFLVDDISCRNQIVDDYSTSSGGFTLGIRTNEFDKVEVYLKFTLEESFSFED